MEILPPGPPQFKVAHLMPFNALGGTEIATLRIIRASRRHGVDHVAFLLEGADQALTEAFQAEKIPAFVTQRPVPSLLRRSLPFWRRSHEFSRELKRQGVDLVHCADILGAYSGSLAGRLAGLPVLCHVRNRYDDVERRDHFFLRPVSHFAFVSQATWRGFPYPVPPHRGSVLYDGIAPASDAELSGCAAQSPQVREEFSIPAGAILFGMFGRIAPQKDYDTLIRAVAQVVAQRQDVYFMLCGEYRFKEQGDDFYRKVSAQIDAAGLREYFRFTGFRTDVPRLMGAIDVQVHSTHWEGLPLAVLEGMGRARAVIATDVDGIPEVVAHGSTGWLYPHGDAGALAACLLEAAGNLERCRAMGLAGRQVVESRFTDAAFERNLMNLYYQVLRRTPPPG